MVPLLEAESSVVCNAFDYVCPCIHVIVSLMAYWQSPMRAFVYLVSLLITTKTCHRLSLIRYESTETFYLYVRRNMFLHSNVN